MHIQTPKKHPKSILTLVTTVKQALNMLLQQHGKKQLLHMPPRKLVSFELHGDKYLHKHEFICAYCCVNKQHLIEFYHNYLLYSFYIGITSTTGMCNKRLCQSNSEIASSFLELERKVRLCTTFENRFVCFPGQEKK